MTEILTLAHFNHSKFEIERSEFTGMIEVIATIKTKKEIYNIKLIQPKEISILHEIIDAEIIRISLEEDSQLEFGKYTISILNDGDFSTKLDDVQILVSTC